MAARRVTNPTTVAWFSEGLSRKVCYDEDVTLDPLKVLNLGIICLAVVQNAALSPVFTLPSAVHQPLASSPGALGSNALDRPGDSKILYVELLPICFAPFSALAPSDHK